MVRAYRHFLYGGVVVGSCVSKRFKQKHVCL